jgi:hypothetical protein
MEREAQPGSPPALPSRFLLLLPLTAHGNLEAAVALTGCFWEALGKQSLPREHRSREERPGLCDLRMYPYKKGEAEGT